MLSFFLSSTKLEGQLQTRLQIIYNIYTVYIYMLHNQCIYIFRTYHYMYTLYNLMYLYVFFLHIHLCVHLCISVHIHKHTLKDDAEPVVTRCVLLLESPKIPGDF